MKTAKIVPVLMYHHITPEGGMINTIPERFESQLRALREAGCTTLTAAAFKDFLMGKPVPEKSVLLTFDDGYLDNWVYAHPILAKYNMHAVMFLITADIGTDARTRPVMGSSEPLPGCPDHLTCKALAAEGRKDEYMARWSEIHAMARAGTFEFHSHTHTHTRWDQQVPRDQKIHHINQELQQSRLMLEQQFGECSDQLCWPQGYFDQDYIEAAQAHGFNVLYTTNAFGFNRAGTNPLRVYRIAVTDRPGKWLMKRLTLAWSPVRGGGFHHWKAWRKRRRQARQKKRQAD